jgi:pimeloyl-ACP methyl ester carboxylesterase
MIRTITHWIAALTVALLLMALLLGSAAHAQGAAPGNPAALVGAWRGVVKTPASGNLTVLLQISAADARMDIPDQGAFGLPVKGLTLSGTAAAFQTPTLNANWRGTFDPGAQTLTGVFAQGIDVPLAFTRFDLSRPQTPKAPFPYRVEAVRVPSAAGVTLAGSLTLPPGKGPFPAAVMITGSGKQDRDETLFGHKPFAVIADALTRRGVAVLRLDDRGAGGSTGDFAAATTQDFADDIKAAVAVLRARKDIAPAKVGLIGHSEGGMIGPMVAAADPKIAFVVMLAGPGVPFHELMAAQRAAIGKAAGVSPAITAANEQLVSRAETLALASKTPAEAEAKIRADLTEKHVPPAIVERVARTIGSPGMFSMLTNDTQPNLVKLRMPVLAMIGGKDLQVPAELNIPALKVGLKDDHQATVVELPGLNHLFQDAQTGLVSEYITNSQTMAPAALDLMTDWVVAHSGKAAAR